jgi:hypothetical protein
VPILLNCSSNPPPRTPRVPSCIYMCDAARITSVRFYIVSIKSYIHPQPAAGTRSCSGTRGRLVTDRCPSVPILSDLPSPTRPPPHQPTHTHCFISALPLQILGFLLVLRRERLGLAPCRRHVRVSPWAVATAVATAGPSSEVRLCEASTKWQVPSRTPQFVRGL